MRIKGTNEQLRSGLRKGLIGIGGVLLIGVIGYHFIEGWNWSDSLYMTIITVSTVGFAEVHPLSPLGRIFTALLILVGVGLVAYSLSRVVEILFQRSLTNVLGRRIMSKKIMKMKEHTIICGYGNTGSRVAEELTLAQKPFVVIDINKEISSKLTDVGIPHIIGDATDEEVLNTANICNAGALVAALNSDAENLFLTLTASGICPDLLIIARVNEPGSTRKFKKAGASRIISPIASGASQIAQIITRPSIVDFIELFEKDKSIALQISEHPIEDESPLIGKTLAEARIRQTLGGMAITIKHHTGTTTFDPGPNTRLKLGDTLVLIQKPENKKD